MLNRQPSSRDFAIVLAAGASTRMGVCKAELPWLNGATLLSYQVEQLWLANIRPVVVVGPHNAKQLQKSTQPCQWVLNPFPEAGKVSSILTGLSNIPADFRSLTIVAIDQPRPTWIYQTLLQAHLKSVAPITAPTYQGKMGHPLIFSAAVEASLTRLSEETLGLRQIVREFAGHIQTIELVTSDILLDLNTPEYYQNAFYKLKQPPQNC